MTRYFSAEAGGFFDDALHGELPSDAVALTDNDYHALLAAQAEGKIFAVDDGIVLAVDRPPPSPEAQLAIIRAQRDRLLAATDAMVSVPDYPISSEQHDALIHWRAAMRDVPQELNPAAPFDTVTWPPRPEWLGERGEILMGSEG